MVRNGSYQRNFKKLTGLFYRMSIGESSKRRDSQCIDTLNERREEKTERKSQRTVTLRKCGGRPF